MRLLADENIHLRDVDILRRAGHDITAVAEFGPGSSDIEILAHARRERRLLITFDRDFGELVFHARVLTGPGVVFLRFVPSHPGDAAGLLRNVLERGDIAFYGFFTVVERTRVRRRRLPENPEGLVRERPAEYLVRRSRRVRPASLIVQDHNL